MYSSSGLTEEIKVVVLEQLLRLHRNKLGIALVDITLIIRGNHVSDFSIRMLR